MQTRLFCKCSTFCAVIITLMSSAFDRAWASSVLGTVTVAGTMLDTEGGKSDKHVVVYLEKVGDKTYPAPPAEHALIDQVGSVFIPHVLALQQGTTVDFLNSDSFEHNVFSVDECCEMNLGNFPGGAKEGFPFNVAGEGVMLCKLHPEMAAYVVVLETPYFVVAEVNGETQSATYEITGVPAGAYTLNVWNKRTEMPAREIVVSEGQNADVDVELEKKQRKKRKRKG